MKKVLTVTMDGIRYHASRPADCRHCFFWKNRKKGCVLGKENCYYLIEPPKGPSKCEGCPYKRAKPCVLVPCYKDLLAPLEKRGDAFFKRLGKRLDSHVADKLLRDGRVRLKDCKSAKGKTYNATVLLSCEADGRSKFSLEFEGGC